MSTSLSDGARTLLAKLETRLKGKPGIVNWNHGPDSMLAELTCNGWTVPDAERAARELERAGVLVIVKTGHFWMMDLHELDVLTFDVPGATPQASADDASATKALWSDVDLAERYGLKIGPLKSRLQRWRPDNRNGWIEVADPKPNEPRYLYRLHAVMPIIEDMQSTSERPAKKK